MNDRYITSTAAARALGYATNGNIAVACQHGLLRCVKETEKGRWKISEDSVLDVLISMDLQSFREQLNLLTNYPGRPIDQLPLNIRSRLRITPALRASDV
jgi:hypothetical protein